MVILGKVAGRHRHKCERSWQRGSPHKGKVQQWHQFVLSLWERTMETATPYQVLTLGPVLGLAVYRYSFEQSQQLFGQVILSYDIEQGLRPKGSVSSEAEQALLAPKNPCRIQAGRILDMILGSQMSKSKQEMCALHEQHLHALHQSPSEHSSLLFLCKHLFLQNQDMERV